MTDEGKAGLNIVKNFYQRINQKQSELYYSLDVRMFDKRVKCGYYPAYVKGEDGQYTETDYPVATVSIKGLCDFDVDFEKIYVSTALGGENAFKLNYKEFEQYRFEIAPFKKINDILFTSEMNIEDFKEKIPKVKANAFYYTFFFNYDELTRDNVLNFAKLLNKREFFYK